MRDVKFYILITLVALSLSFSYGGCPGTGPGGPGNDDDNATAPSISVVKLFKIVDDVPIESLSFNIGDESNVSVTATDPDLDITTLFISQYLLPNLDSPHEPISEVILTTQQGPTMDYFFIDPTTVEGPAGDWQICFFIVDKAGNESNEVCVNIIIHEAEAAATNLNMSLSSEGAFDFSNNTIEGEVVE